MPPTNRTVHPERALLTPAWLGALALLVANDHWLKGADLIPGVLTGKLSDFAGMLVAPTLLAALLRVRTTRALLACHVAVAVVFAGIQVSSEFAGLWSAAMGLLGHPWVITCDLTDLIALPCLWLSWRLLVPAMDPERPALIGLQRSAVAAASVFGLWATVATSDDESFSEDDCCSTDTDGGWDDDTDDDDGGWQEIDGQVYIHNPNEFAISLHIRRLRSDVQIDCEAIAGDPGRLLPDEAFGEAEHWELPPTTNVAVRGPYDCGAAKIAGEGIPEQIVFSVDLGWGQPFPGSHDRLDQLHWRGAAIQIDSSGAEWIGGQGWRHTPKTEAVPQPEECMADPGEWHLDWSELPSHLVYEIQSLTAGLDGCHAIELREWGSEQEPITWYLCAPAASIRFEVGELYRIAIYPRLVEAQLVDPVTQEPLVDDLGRPRRVLRWEHGVANTSWIPVQALSIELPACPWNVVDGSVEVARKLDLQIGDGVPAAPGVPAVHVDEYGIRHELTLGRARSLALTAGQLPYDVEYALVSEPNP